MGAGSSRRRRRRRPSSTSRPRRRAIPTRTGWAGRYTCAQGDTAARVALSIADDGHAFAQLSFGPLPENPSVPEGSYTLRGHARIEPSGAIAIDVVPDAWILQPPGYVMVGFSAVSDAERRHMVGRMSFPGCGAIELAR